jgi:hypothetical protein
VCAHNTIQTGFEQNDFITLFSMVNESKCTVLSVLCDGMTLLAEYKNIFHKREIKINNDTIVINDSCNYPFRTEYEKIPCTKGYGKCVE